MKFTTVMLNPTVGDLAGNVQLHKTSIFDKNKTSDLIIFPEMSITGYPLEDLVLRESFLIAAENAANELIQWINTYYPNTGVIFGFPRKCPGGIHNSAVLVYQGTTQFVDKVALPNYGPFDEKRVFVPGGEPWPVLFKGYKLGLMICEDCWNPLVSKSLHENGAVMLISINGSPFEMKKQQVRYDLIKDRVNETGLPFLYMNMTGGQDELVFDGGTIYWDGTTLQTSERFKENTFTFEVVLKNNSSHYVNGQLLAWVRDDGSFSHWFNTDWAEGQTRPISIGIDNFPNYVEDLSAPYQAMVLGLRDYMRKQKRKDGTPVFTEVVLGYSGGVDSGLVAAIACDAIGPDNVHLVRLPSKYSSEHSLTDAAKGALRLGAAIRTIPIEPVVESLRVAYCTATPCTPKINNKVKKWTTGLQGVSDENIQARARGTLLMAISNNEGPLLLTTGNKSENSVGYGTLYGDQAGGFNPIKDLYKTTVWALCRWRNNLSKADIDSMGMLGNETEVVPEEIINKPPSAELAPNQFDSNSLPEYNILDDLLKCMIEKELGDIEIIKLGYDEITVKRVRALLDGAEFKRRQAAPGVKITRKLHGRERRYPIVNAWHE
jgi:NAD+ synthase